MSEIYRFNDFQLNKKTRRLFQGERHLHLSPRAYGILLYLVERQGQIVTKEELIQAVWNDAFVEESNLAVHISALRNLLGERRGDDKYIQTITGQGYSFVSDVKKTEETKTPLSSKPVSVNHTPAIAVLPFKNKSGDPKFDILADGITESLISSLSHLPQLKVIAYSAVSKYKGQDIDIQDIAFILGVNKILSGSISGYGDKLEVTAELIDISDLSLIWSSQFDGFQQDIFEVKNSISSKIVETLKLKLPANSSALNIANSVIDIEAYKLCLKGNHLLNKRTKEAFAVAIEYFNAAIKIAPNYASAYTNLAHAYFLQGSYFFRHATEAISRAEQAIKISLSLDKNLSETYAVIGLLNLFYSFDLDEAKLNLKKAIELNHNNAIAHSAYSVCLLDARTKDECVIEMKKALELDPLSPAMNGGLASRYYLLKEYTKAISHAEATLELYPDFAYGHYYLAFSYAHINMIDKALAEVETALSLQNHTEIVALKGYICGLSGQTQKAGEILKNLIDKSSYEPVDYTDIATIFVALNENDKAFEYLEKARLARMNHFCILKVDPRFDNIRSDPRFDEFLKKIGLA